MLIIDRFEGNQAICENEKGEMQTLFRAELPKGSMEGDCILLNEKGKYEISQEKTAKRREKIRSLLGKLGKN